MLKPLLNDKYRAVTTKLPPDVQADYDLLVAALKDRDESNIQDAAVTFWNHTKKSGVSGLEERQILMRLVSRFVSGTEEECRDSIVKEWMIQRLPKEARQYVREKTPATSMEAVRLVEKFFSAREESYTIYRASTISYDQPKYTDRQEQRYQP